MSDLASPRSMKLEAHAGGARNTRSVSPHLDSLSGGPKTQDARHRHLLFVVCDFGCLQNMKVNGKDYPIYSGK